MLVSNTMDSRLRGNDVVFERAARDEGSLQFAEITTAEILRFAQNDMPLAPLFRIELDHEEGQKTREARNFSRSAGEGISAATDS